MNIYKKTSIALYAIFIVAVVIVIYALWNTENKFVSVGTDENTSYEYIYGTIENIRPSSKEGDVGNLIVRVKYGEMKDEIITAPVSSINNFNNYKTGEDVQIYKTIDAVTGETIYETADYYHQKGLIWIFIIFAVVSIIVARKKGLNAILSVIISLFLFYSVFLKLVIAGYSPISSCLFFVFIVTALTIPLIHGFNKKSLSAILAIIIGYFISIYITFVFRDIAQLGISPDEDFRTLGIMFPKMNLSDILIASLFMGAVGALIDTAISISSAIFEAIKEHAKQTYKDIYFIGMEVGKDILGSMINTLLFAYLASALPFLILVSLSKSGTVAELINMDFIALELTRTFIGAISLVILIPITASISAYILTKVGNRLEFGFRCTDVEALRRSPPRRTPWPDGAGLHPSSSDPGLPTE